ncbi:MAG: ATP-binding protein [Peptococcaceae bacterium]|mgnify:CR=1 FL=1|nr:ATP-binding protein [Peptococcaceae bacterium]
MLQRKIMDELIAWKNRDDKMCLVVKGARQVGKTYIINQFARENYEYYTYINFDENPAYKTIFDGDLDVDTLTKQISLRVKNAELVPHKTIIFLDEIQNCPKARTALKFLAQDGRYDVVASGSLLGINYKEVPSYPVGYVEHLEMYSLDFEEFLWANGVSAQSVRDIRYYFEHREPVPDAMHEKMMELFKEYIVVGGMPRVVQDFVSNHNFASVLKLQKAIVADYMDDIAKYAEGTEKAKARACFLSIPKQLSKDYKKFQYSQVETRGTSRKFAGSLMWLYDAGVINFCYNLAKPELPLEGNARTDAFKVYMRDTGLLMAMLEDGSQEDIIDGNLGIYKGAVYENIIADIFGKAGKKLYYFEHKSQIEIDFFIRYQKQAAAIEVKSAENTKAKSMQMAITHWGVTHGIKLSSKNVSGNDTVENFPLYMAMFL